MNIQVDIQTATAEAVPAEKDIRSWITAAVATQPPRDQLELTVRLVDIEEMSTLNQTYRGKSGPTNVLSFPADLPAGLELPLLGDIIICAPVVRTEATQQNKDETAHWAHMTVHGTLHLFGYDHLQEEEAIIMEALETDILHVLNFTCPYEGAAAQKQAHP